MLLEFPKCVEIKVNVKENKALLFQKNVKDSIFKKEKVLLEMYKDNCKSF